jgi:hypothetical protein
VFVSAARKGGNAVVMVVNLSAEGKPLAIACGGGWKTASCRITDETRAFEETAFPSVLPPWSFIVAELSP